MAYQYQKREINGDTLTPIAIFNRLQGEKKFILESSSNHQDKGRFSFIGVNPFKEMIGEGEETIIKVDGQTETLIGKPLEIVKQHIPQVDLGLPFDFYCGAVGYVGYDSIRQYAEIGSVLDDEIDMPDIHFMIYQDVLIFDHKNQSLTLIAVDLSKSRSHSALKARLDQLVDQIFTDPKEQHDKVTKLTFESSLDQATFIEKVKEIQRYIYEQDVSQVVLSQRMKAHFTGDPFSFYRRLRLSNPSPYMFYLDFDDYLVLGTSPESLVKVNERTVITNPIAGTKPRGNTPMLDKALADELLADPKERAEHEMLVDLSRHDLSKICRQGSIQIPKYMVIERYQYVMHIVSEITGKLDEPYTSIDALISLFPAGTVSGAPKIKAMQIINDLEQVKRGVYAGAIGYINMNGDLDFALAIRTMVIKDNQAYVQAGAGIVHDSDPSTEYQETLNKAKALLEVVQS